DVLERSGHRDTARALVVASDGTIHRLDVGRVRAHQHDLESDAERLAVGAVREHEGAVDRGGVRPVDLEQADTTADPHPAIAVIYDHHDVAPARPEARPTKPRTLLLVGAHLVGIRIVRAGVLV